MVEIMCSCLTQLLWHVNHTSQALVFQHQLKRFVDFTEWYIMRDQANNLDFLISDKNTRYNSQCEFMLSKSFFSLKHSTNMSKRSERFVFVSVIVISSFLTSILVHSHHPICQHAYLRSSCLSTSHNTKRGKYITIADLILFSNICFCKKNQKYLVCIFIHQ